MTKTILHLMLSGIFLVLTGLLVLAAVFLKEPFFQVYSPVSAWITGTLGHITSVVPAVLWELLVVLLLALFLFTLVRAILKHRAVRWLTGLLLLVTIAVFVFVGSWGLNYYAPPMAQRLGLENRPVTEEELFHAAEYYRDRANELALQAERDEDGKLIPWKFEDLAPDARQGYEVLAQKYSCFDGNPAPPKKLLLTYSLMGKMGVMGIFICFTGESSVSTTTYPLSLPFIMCHEQGHRMAFAREDEANFAGFLACSMNPRPEFQYSGYYNAFRYCYNALAGKNQEAAGRIWAGVSPELAADCLGAAPHYDKVENKAVSQAAGKVYDSYLKSFSSNIESYGEVTELLVLWRLAGNG